MITKFEQEYIFKTVGNETISNGIVEYLNRNKEEVGYEVFKNSDGDLDKDKRVFKYMFKANWTKERFLKYLPFFYYSETIEKVVEDVDSDSDGIWMSERSFANLLDGYETEWININTPLPEDGYHIILDNEKVAEEVLGISTKLLYCYDLLVLDKGRKCKELIDYIYDNNLFDPMWFYFDEWVHYLTLCEERGKDEWFPIDLDYSLRILQESVGEKIELIQPASELRRNGTSLSFYFYHVPVDSAGNPVMRWLGIKVDGDDGIAVKIVGDEPFDPVNELLIVKTKPNTRVRKYDKKNDKWNVIYTGPRNINVDFSQIKKKRNELGFTQDDVSKAIDVSTRTYQKWEKGDIKGISGFFLLRLMKYLDIGIDEITIDEGK